MLLLLLLVLILFVLILLLILFFLITTVAITSCYYHFTIYYYTIIHSDATAPPTTDCGHSFSACSHYSVIIMTSMPRSHARPSGGASGRCSCLLSLQGCPRFRSRRRATRVSTGPGGTGCGRRIWSCGGRWPTSGPRRGRRSSAGSSGCRRRRPRRRWRRRRCGRRCAGGWLRSCTRRFAGFGRGAGCDRIGCG